MENKNWIFDEAIFQIENASNDLEHEYGVSNDEANAIAEKVAANLSDADYFWERINEMIRDEIDCVANHWPHKEK